MSEFSYLSQKILDSPTLGDPYDHIQIDNFLNDDHLSKVLNNSQVHFSEIASHEELIQTLLDKKYEIISFPGCKVDINEYLARLHSGVWTYKDGVPIDSFGITFRLTDYQDTFLKSLITYLNGDEFHNSIKKRFDIEENTEIISAVQKNLTKYQISPHPDVSTKSMTYLININKDESVSEYEVHTHMLKFKPEYDYIYGVWEKGDLEREWVPWDWCDTVKTHSPNNSLIMFKPSHKTLHAVNLDYPHLKFQRTQIYGNLNYPDRPKKEYRPNKYKDLDKK